MKSKGAFSSDIKRRVPFLSAFGCKNSKDFYCKIIGIGVICKGVRAFVRKQKARVHTRFGKDRNKIWQFKKKMP